MLRKTKFMQITLKKIDQKKLILSKNQYNPILDIKIEDGT